MAMNRRQFLQVSAGMGAGLVLGNSRSAHGIIPACGITPPQKDKNRFLAGHRIIDAHAHPSQFFYGGTPPVIDDSSTVEQLCEFGVEASTFAAVGDFVARGVGMTSLGNDFNATRYQLSNITPYLSDIIIVDRAADLPSYDPGGVKPGAIMAIEGGEALVGNPDHLNDFYFDHYVRMITLVHYTSNSHPLVLGDQMTDFDYHNGLSPLGLQVIERMIDMNMIIDVAHASKKTLLEVCNIARSAGVPVIDSHTSLWRSYYTPPPSGFIRMRTLYEMEAVARTGGVVCTWPLKCDKGCAGERVDLAGWAAEIDYLIQSLGVDHVGLGTDGGGVLPFRLVGYKNIKDLNGLAENMAAQGLSYAEIHAYMGDNIARILNQVLI